MNRDIKKLVRTVLILILLVGCVKQPCPPQDLTFIATFSDGWRPIFLKKGYLDDKKTSMDEEQYQEFLEKYNIYLQEQRELEYQRRFGD